MVIGCRLCEILSLLENGPETQQQHCRFLQSYAAAMVLTNTVVLANAAVLTNISPRKHSIPHKCRGSHKHICPHKHMGPHKHCSPRKYNCVMWAGFIFIFPALG